MNCSYECEKGFNIRVIYEIGVEWILMALVLKIFLLHWQTTIFNPILNMESRRRNTNFSNQEVKIISEFISERQTTLFAPLSRQVAEVDLSTKSTTAVYVTDFASYKPCLIESEFGVYFKVIIEVERIQTIPQQSVPTQISSTNTLSIPNYKQRREL